MPIAPPQEGRKPDPYAKVFGSGQGQGPAKVDPYAKVFGGSQAQAQAPDPFAGAFDSTQVGTPAPPAQVPVTSAKPQAVPTNRWDAYKEAMLQLVKHPGDAIGQMVQVTLLDAMKTFAAPIKGTDPNAGDPYNYLSAKVGYVPPKMAPIERKEFKQSALNTVANVAFGPVSKVVGPVAAAAGVGAIQSPDDPLLGAMVGGSIGVGFKAGGKLLSPIAERIKAKAKVAEGVPTDEAGQTVPVIDESSAPKPIRDLDNMEVLRKTPAEIDALAKQAAKEEADLFVSLFGPKGARRYRSALRQSTSASSSPEVAAKAIQTLEKMKEGLTDAQGVALDEVLRRGFTSRRLRSIHNVIKDYTPETLAQIDDATLINQFGEILMSKKPDKNLSGLYRLHRVYAELAGRNVEGPAIARGVYDYMLKQGAKADGLSKLVVNKIADVRKTMDRLNPEVANLPKTVAPTAAPPEVSPEVRALAQKVLGGQATPEEQALLRTKLDEMKYGPQGAPAPAPVPPPEAPPSAPLPPRPPVAPTAAPVVSPTEPLPMDKPAVPGAKAAYLEDLKKSLGPVSEEQLQQDLQELVPPVGTPATAEAAARAGVEAARTTPFPPGPPDVPGYVPREARPASKADLQDIQSGISPPPAEAPSPAKVDPLDAKLSELKARVARGEKVAPRQPLPAPVGLPLELTPEFTKFKTKLRAAEKSYRKGTPLGFRDKVVPDELVEAWFKKDPIAIAGVYAQLAKGQAAKALKLFQTSSNLLRDNIDHPDTFRLVDEVEATLRAIVDEPLSESSSSFKKRTFRQVKARLEGLPPEPSPVEPPKPTANEMAYGYRRRFSEDVEWMIALMKKMNDTEVYANERYSHDVKSRLYRDEMRELKNELLRHGVPEEVIETRTKGELHYPGEESPAPTLREAPAPAPEPRTEASVPLPGPANAPPPVEPAAVTPPVPEPVVTPPSQPSLATEPVIAEPTRRPASVKIGQPVEGLPTYWDKLSPKQQGVKLVELARKAMGRNTEESLALAEKYVKLREEILSKIPTESKTAALPQIEPRPVDLKSAARDAGYMEGEISSGYFDKEKALQGYKHKNGELVQATEEILANERTRVEAEIAETQKKLDLTRQAIEVVGEDEYNAKYRDRIWGSDSRVNSLSTAERVAEQRIADVRNTLSSWERQLERAKAFLKDEGGYLDMDAFLDPLQRNVKKLMNKLTPESREIQEQISLDNPEGNNALSPMARVFKTLTGKDYPIEGLRTALVRKTYPVEKLVERVEKETGVKTPIEQDPAKAIEMLSSWTSKVESFFVDGPFRDGPMGPIRTGTRGFRSILDGMKDYNAFRRLAIASRVVELHDQGRNVETGISYASAVKEVANASPEMKAALAETHNYLNDVLQYAVDADLLDPKTGAFIRSLGQAYIPLDRVLSHHAKSLGPVKYSAINTANKFRALVGNKLKIVDPIWSISDYTERIIRASELNKMANKLIDYADAYPDQTKGWIERESNVSASKSPQVVGTGRNLQALAKSLGINLDLNTAKHVGRLLNDSNLLVDGDIMRVRRGGEVHQYKIDPVLGKILRSLDPKAMETWMSITGAPSQWLKTGITGNPAFAGMQAFVGAFQSKIQSRHGFRITEDPLKGLAHAVFQTPTYREARAAGGTAGYLSAPAHSTEASVRMLTNKGMSRKLAQGIAHPFELLQKLARPIEEMNRIGEYARARKQGASALEAAYSSKEVDTNFSMIGTQMAGLSHLIAFANPFIQGVDKAARTLNPTTAAGRKALRTAIPAALTSVTAPSIFFWIAGKGDEEVRRQQRSEAGQRYWFLRMPGGEVAKIPKPYVYGEIFANTTEAVLDQMERDTPEQYEMLAKGIKNAVSFSFLPTAMQVPYGLMGNVDPMNNYGPIVSESDQGLDPALQYDDNTTEASKKIGEAVGVSPAKLDFAVRNLSGTLGMTAYKATDALIDNEGVSPPTPVSADLPLIGRFFGRYPSQSVEPIRTFYKEAEKASVALQSANKYVTLNDSKRALAYSQEHQEAIALANMYAKARMEMAKDRELLSQIKAMPDNVFTPETKRQLVDQVMERLIDKTDQINTQVRYIRRAKRNLGKAKAAGAR